MVGFVWEGLSRLAQNGYTVHLNGKIERGFPPLDVFCSFINEVSMGTSIFTKDGTAQGVAKQRLIES